MNYSGIKLVVTDMDGTLLNNKGEVSERFFDLVTELRKHHIRVAVASGRQYYSLKNKLEPVEQQLIFIAENGAIALEGGQLLHIRPMNHNLALELVQQLKASGMYVIVCGRKAAYIEQTKPEFMKPFLMHYDKYEVVADLLQVKEEEILKVTVCDLSGAEQNILPNVLHFQDQLQVKLSGEIWVDFTHKDAQKGNALKEIQKRFGISREETMAFGDYLNDLELFDQAHYSFAMENAHEEVRKKANYFARSNEEEGVLLILEEMLEHLKVAGPEVKP